MLWCCIEPERVEKTRPIMEAMAAGFGGRTCLGDPPDDGEMAVFWGQLWTTLRMVPKFLKQRRPFLHIDNGYVDPGRGSLTGYYRITYNSPSPVLWKDAPPARLVKPMAPWRETGRSIVVGLPSGRFGRAWGIDTGPWLIECVRELRRHTQRPAFTRPKQSATPLARDLHHAWALYTHSSNVAVDAVLAGIPVFCAPSCPAAPVGNLDLAQIERPEMPDRAAWYRSLIAQQYTVDEMRSGLAREFLDAALKG